MKVSTVKAMHDIPFPILNAAPPGPPAAMAAASLVFHTSNPSYSALLLRHARQLFRFAARRRGRYHASVPAAKGYYPSVSGYGDELLWAALWLRRATGDSQYLDYVVDNAYALGGATWSVSEFSWDIKYAGVQILAAKVLMEEGAAELSSHQRRILEEYKSKGEHYLCACLNLHRPDKKNNNVRPPPAGLFYTRQWNNLQYVSTAAFILAAYSDYLDVAGIPLRCPAAGEVPPAVLLSFARSQADYILGNNPHGLSYLVGFGDRYPSRVHHRAASADGGGGGGEFVGCTEGYHRWFGRNRRNPHVVVGAVVGGPDSADGFRDARSNFVQTEACTYNTAPMVGVFARLIRDTNSTFFSI
ncbi:LOW QUALITY PROTEIN: endoglucanase 7-like [Phalaenopsis equestris]|uniref:LOW QUALITY PROTEIN: endoglucanase 7-like n=1 Tax=Phalaenopsis equestris TaxID=78828 RepID=UPI0009E5E1C6|nr:LOW QUALITY PROTEIN: endoglucanase 7-like [Phalaenopsis equestris]